MRRLATLFMVTGITHAVATEPVFDPDEPVKHKSFLSRIEGTEITTFVVRELQEASGWTRDRETRLSVPKPAKGMPGKFVGGGQVLMRLPPIVNDRYHFSVDDGFLVVTLAGARSEHLRLRLSVIAHTLPARANKTLQPTPDPR